MNAFVRAVNDIFKCRDFIETCIINECAYECICTAQPNEEVFSEAGLVQDIAFSLRIKLPCRVALGDKIIFREKTYKAIRVLIDSANASVTIDLQDLSKA